MYCEYNPSLLLRSAINLLNLLIMPILMKAEKLAESEYANYIIQYVLRTNCLEIQRSYIIRNSIL